MKSSIVLGFLLSLSVGILLGIQAYAPVRVSTENRRRNPRKA
ncbi:MAG: hypothetical protein Q7R81_03260 [Candidatus Peregrinibacteria bacterium]|nr:hypothetical protein [Candidatus Peregrinibacteria bacterium]